MSGLSSATDLVHLEPRISAINLPIGAAKAPQLAKRLHHSNSAARGHIAIRFYNMVLGGSVIAAWQS